MSQLETVNVNIHDIVTVEIDKSFPWCEDWLEVFGILRAIERTPGAPSAVLKLIYTESLNTKGMRRLRENIYTSKLALLDTRSRMRLTMPAPNTLVLETNHPCGEWIVPALQVALLSRGATFLHAAGVERDGRALIFPSWGGIGKTALVSHLVRDRGWRLLGDDLVILSSEGICWAFPKPLAVYSYHRGVLPEVFSKGQGPIAPILMNSLLTNIAIRMKPLLRPFPRLLQLARKHNPQCTTVSPDEVFGLKSIAQKGRPEMVIWLDRLKGLGEPRLCEAYGGMATRIVGSTISEWDPWCVQVQNVAMGLGILNMNGFYCAWFRTVADGIANARQALLYLPADLPVGEVPQAVVTLLREEGCDKL